MADALDHGGVIEGVGEDGAVGELGTEGGEGGIVGNVAGGEHEGGFLTVKLSDCAFKGDGVLVVAGDVAGAAGAGAVGVEGLMHGFEDLGVAAHA